MNWSILALTYQKALEGFLLTLNAEGKYPSTIEIYQ